MRCFEKRQNQEITFTFCFCCSVAKLCLTLCDPMDNSMPRFPVLHYLPKFAQTHIHWVSDAIQPSHSLLLPSSLALPSFSASRSFPVSQHRIRLPKYSSFSVSSSSEYSGLISFGLTCLISLLCKELSWVFSSTTVQKHQCFGDQSSYGPTLTSILDYWKNRSFDYMDLCQQSDVSAF